MLELAEVGDVDAVVGRDVAGAVAAGDHVCADRREVGVGRPVERELALVKVAGKGEVRVEALRLAEAFRANVIDANIGHFIFEITGKPSKIDQFIQIMAPLGLVEVCRTGLAAMNRGPIGMDRDAPTY